MTTIPICQDLELLMAPFLNSQLTLTHQLEWDCKCPFFQEDQFISCLKIPNPSLIENKKVTAKIRFGFKVKGSSQLAVICTCLRMETQHLSLQTRFVQNTLVSQNDVSNNIEWQIGHAEYMKNIGLACIFICTYPFILRAYSVAVLSYQAQCHSWLLYQTEE